MANSGKVLVALNALMGRLIDQELWTELGALQLSETQFRALRFLRHHGGAELAGLAAALAISAPAATKLANRLEKAGWVTRCQVEVDRRCVELSLTERAEQALAKMDGRIEGALAQVLAELAEEPRRQLLSGATAFLARGLERVPREELCQFCGQSHLDDCPLSPVRKKGPPSFSQAVEE